MVETIRNDSDQDGLQLKKGINEESSKQIISSISHELRTPLSIISSNLQLLQSWKGEIDEDIRKETFDLCEEAIKSMSRFLDDIYFLNISNKGELKKEIEKVDLLKYFNTLVKEFAFSEFDEQRLKLSFEFKEDIVFVDKELLKRIMYNVISNALKFSPDDVDVNVCSNDHQIMIDVSDKGIGIDKEELELVFEPFFRGNNVKMISGTGLGMSIVKKSLDCMGGKIELESNIGKGTNVKIIIPTNGK